MIIKSITVENFRPYYGRQKVEFSEGGNNITIIFGDNGGGKTSLYRAIIFALFGDRHIEQDDNKSPVHFVNRKAISENPHNPVTAICEILFEHNDHTYTIKRCIKGMKFNNDIIEELDLSEMTIVDPKGNTNFEKIQDDDTINDIVDNIINEKIKNFFFFDGEQIDTLTTTKQDKRDSVKAGISNATQLDSLEYAHKILKSVQGNIDDQIKANSKRHTLKEKIDAKKMIENNREKREEEIKAKRHEILNLQNDLESLEEKLNKNTEANILSIGIERLNDQLNNIENEYSKESKETMRKIVKLSPLSMLEDHTTSVKERLQTIYDSESNIIPLPLIDKTLLQNTCACCGLSLEEHLNSIVRLKTLKEDYEPNDLNEFISIIASYYRDINVENLKSVMNNFTQFEHLKRNEQRNLEDKIEIEQNKLEEYAITDRELNSLNENIKTTKEKIKQLEITVAIIDKEIKDSDKQIEEDNRMIEKLMESEESLSSYKVSKEYAQKIENALGRSLDTYNTEMQQKLTKKTTEIFKDLIDERDKNLISEIRINEKYEIEIFDSNYRAFTQDISQGQRKIAAISFIMALTQIASESEGRIPFPFFMDTPFSNFDLDHRLSLINKIPSLISQWILLLTDTEMALQEEEAFKATGKIGRWYKINRIEKYHAELIEISTEKEMLR